MQRNANFHSVIFHIDFTLYKLVPYFFQWYFGHTFKIHETLSQFSCLSINFHWFLFMIINIHWLLFRSINFHWLLFMLKLTPIGSCLLINFHWLLFISINIHWLLFILINFLMAWHNAIYSPVWFSVTVMHQWNPLTFIQP